MSLFEYTSYFFCIVSDETVSILRYFGNVHSSDLVEKNVIILITSWTRYIFLDTPLNLKG